MEQRRQHGQRQGVPAQRTAAELAIRFQSQYQANTFGDRRGRRGPRTDSHMLAGLSIGDNQVNGKRKWPA